MSSFCTHKACSDLPKQLVLICAQKHVDFAQSKSGGWILWAKTSLPEWLGEKSKLLFVREVFLHLLWTIDRPLVKDSFLTGSAIFSQKVAKPSHWSCCRYSERSELQACHVSGLPKTGRVSPKRLVGRSAWPRPSPSPPESSGREEWGVPNSIYPFV